MTRNEFFHHLSTGTNKVKSIVDIPGVTDLTGEVQDIQILGKDIKVSVLYPGKKFEVWYTSAEELSKHTRMLAELAYPVKGK